MDRADFFDLLVDTLDLSESEVNYDSSFSSYNFDSFSKLSIIMLIDTIMNKIISPTDLIQCETLGDVVDLAFQESD